MAIEGPSGYISLSAAGKLTGYSAESLRLLCVAGKVDGCKVGRMWVVNQAEISRLQEKSPATMPTLIKPRSAPSPLVRIGALAVVMMLLLAVPTLSDLTALRELSANLTSRVNAVVVARQQAINGALSRALHGLILKAISRDYAVVPTGLVSGLSVVNGVLVNYPANFIGPILLVPPPAPTPRSAAITRQDAPINVSVGKATLLASLRQLFAEGLPSDLQSVLQGPPGVAGPPGPRGDPGQSLSFVIPTAPTVSNPGGGTLGGITYLSSDQFATRTLTVSSDITQTGGATTLKNTTIQGTLSVAGAQTNLDTLSVSGATTFLGGTTFAGSVSSTGQFTATRAPTAAHIFAPWPSGTSNVSDSTLYINPASSVADGNLLGAAVNGSVKFVVDAEGDVYANNLILSGSTSTGATTIAGNLTVQDNTQLGDASTDTITFIGQINSNVVPAINNFYDLGSSSRKWKDGYLAGALTVGTINGLTITNSTGTLTIANGKTGAISNSLTLVGMDGTTMTFPTTSATIARTDAANTFTGHQTIEGVTSTGATGTGNLVFATSPVLITPNLGTPTTLVGTNITGTAAGLTAGNVTTNANLTGAITSVGNATSLGSFSSANLSGALTDETGSGAAVFGTNPSIAGAALSGTLSGTPTFSGVFTNTAFGTHTLSAGGTGGQILTLRNTTAGTGNYTQLMVGNNLAADEGYLGTFSSTYTTSNRFRADGTLVDAKGAGGLTLSAVSEGIHFYANSATTERMTLDTSGNLGIGTTTPNTVEGTVFGMKLGVSGSMSLSTTSPFLIFDETDQSANARLMDFELDGGIMSLRKYNDDGTSTTNLLSVVRSSGSVGIGTTGPGALLHVVGTSDALANEIRVGSTVSSGNYASFGRSFAAASYGAGIWFNTTQQAHFTGGGLSLGTYVTSDPPANGLIVSGNVGIGTTGPTEQLNIVKNTYTGVRVNNGTFYGRNNAEVGILGNSGTDFKYATNNYAGELAFNDDNAGGWKWYTAASGTAGNAITLGTEKMQLSNAGNLGIGVAPANNVRLRAAGSDATSSNYVVDFTDSNGVDLLLVRNDGTFYTGTSTNSPYNNTTGNAANAYINSSGGILGRSTSSLRFKTDFEPLDASHIYNVLSSLAPGPLNIVNGKPTSAHGFTYRGIGSGDDQRTRFIGWGAETVNQIDPLLVSKDEQGNPNGIMYDRMSVYLTAGWQDHEQRIQELDAKTSAIYSGEGLTQGDVVKLENQGAAIARARGDDVPVGVVSSFVGGKARVEFSGRVPVKVSEENGQVHAGDRLTVSSLVPGYAAKLVQSGQSIGTALEDTNGGAEGLDLISAFVDIGYQHVEVAQSSSGQLLASASDHDLNGFSLLNVKAITSISGKWSIDENGVFTAEKIKTKVVETDQLEVHQGITIYDSATGEPYCMRITNGQTVSATGACGQAAGPSTPTPQESPPLMESPPETPPSEQTSPAEPTPAPEPTSEPSI